MHIVTHYYTTTTTTTTTTTFYLEQQRVPNGTFPPSVSSDFVNKLLDDECVICSEYV